MVELNEYECEMLDIILEAFGVPDSLTRNQLLELFAQDEATAFALIQILIREDLVAEVGKHGIYDLPEKLILKPKGEKFLKLGGFVKHSKKEAAKPAEVNSTSFKLQQQNMKLQNEKLVQQSKLSDLEKKVILYKRLQYLWWVLMVVIAIVFYRWGHAAGVKLVHH